MTVMQTLESVERGARIFGFGAFLVLLPFAFLIYIALFWRRKG